MNVIKRQLLEVDVDDSPAQIGEPGMIGEIATSNFQEHRLFDELRTLARRVAAAGVPDAADWAQRIHAMVNSADDGRATSSKSAETVVTLPRLSPTQLSPIQVMEFSCQCDGKDVTEHVRKTTAFFLLEDSPAIESKAPEFLAALHQFICWADKHRCASLALALRAAEKDFRSLVDSPLDLDATTLSIVWDRLQPEFVLLADSSEVSEETVEPSSLNPVLQVHEDKLDEILNDISSLFVTGEVLKDLCSRLGVEDLSTELLEQVQRITAMFSSQSTALQKNAAALRSVPISRLFSKFPHIASKLASELGKRVNVHLGGAVDEVDKALIEELDLPLSQLIRNCVYHGIELPEQRVARGVEPSGNIWLHAELTRNHLTITIRDDGRGFDVEGQKANVSERRVGMDKVLANLREHGAAICVESEVGVGTTLCLEIPVREAVLVIDGVMCQEAEQTFVIPLENVIEITKVAPSQLTPVHSSLIARIRDHTYAAVRLCDALELETEAFSEDRSFEAILVGARTGEVCLLVERVDGQRQIVMNPMSNASASIDHVAGIAHLGEGQVAHVLRIDELIDSLRN